VETELPAREEYYRLSRAGELRKKAKLLRGCALPLYALVALIWLPCLSCQSVPDFVPHLIAWVFDQLRLYEGDYLDPLPARYLVATALPLLASVPLAVAAVATARGAGRCDRSAAQLEAEHLARYAQLPAGKE
jgi:hypothetical protein